LRAAQNYNLQPPNSKPHASNPKPPTQPPNPNHKTPTPPPPNPPQPTPKPKTPNHPPPTPHPHGPTGRGPWAAPRGGGLFLMSEVPLYCALQTIPGIPLKAFVWHQTSRLYSLLLSSLELTDTNVYEPEIRARLGTTAHLCRVFVVKSSVSLQTECVCAAQGYLAHKKTHPPRTLQ